MLPIRERLNSEIAARIEENNKQRQPVYSENLIIDPDPLGTALKNASKVKETIFHTRPECLEPGYEYEWERVQRMRAEEHPLIEGGRNNGVKLMPTYHFRHKEKLSQRKFNLIDDEWDKSDEKY